MKIYLNYGQHPFVLSNEALELMGRPRYVTFLLDQEGRKITDRGVKTANKKTFPYP